MSSQDLEVAQKVNPNTSQVNPTSIPLPLSVSPDMPESVATSVPNTLVLTLYGTDTKHDGRKDKKATIHTLAAFHIALLGSTHPSGIKSNIITRAVNGPDTHANNVYQIISKELLDSIKNITNGIVKIHINAHSRGACEAIILSNLLAKLKINLANIKTGEEITLEKILKGFNNEVITELKKQPDLLALLTNAEFKNNINSLAISISAIDPVPGNRGSLGGWWLDPDLQTIPDIVVRYTQFEMLDEMSWYFNSLVPKLATKTQETLREITRLPGNHGIPCGTLNIQQAVSATLMPPPETATIAHKKALAAVQKLVLYKMLDDMIARGITDFDFDAIDEQTTYHTSWGDALKPVKTILKDYYSNPLEREKLKLAAYTEIKAGSAFFETIISKNFYPWVSGNRTTPVSEAVRQTHKISGKDVKRQFSTAHAIKKQTYGEFINIEHLVLYIKVTFKNNDTLKAMPNLNETLQKLETLIRSKPTTVHTGDRDIIAHNNIKDMCDSFVVIITETMKHYKPRETKKSKDINELIKIIIPKLIKCLEDAMLNSILSIDELKHISKTIASISKSMDKTSIHDVYLSVNTKISEPISRDKEILKSISLDIGEMRSKTNSFLKLKLEQIKINTENKSLENIIFIEKLKEKYSGLVSSNDAITALLANCQFHKTKLLETKTKLLISLDTIKSELIEAYLNDKANLTKIINGDLLTIDPFIGPLLESEQNVIYKTASCNAAYKERVIELRAFIKEIAKEQHKDLYKELDLEDCIKEAAEKQARENAVEKEKAIAAAALKFTVDNLNRIKIISVRCVKIGCTIGIIVTAAIGSTLLVYFLAPAMVPILIASNIANIIGASTTVGTAALALTVKSLALTAFSGITAGLVTEKISSIYLEKTTPPVERSSPAAAA